MANSKKDTSEPMSSTTPVRKNKRRQAKPCSATNREGEPCQSWAIKGGTVCFHHGGAAPQTVAAARARLLAAADPLMAELIALAQNKKLDPSVRLRAIQDALDRAGLGAKNALELTVDAPWQVLIADIVAEVPDEAIDAARRSLALAPGSPRPHDDGRSYNYESDDLPEVVDGDVVEAATSDSEQSDDSSTGFEGPNRLHRTPEVHDDQPRATAARTARPRRARRPAPR